MKKGNALVYSAVGLAALFFALIAFNYLAGAAAVKLDLTEGRIYTLSEGTRKILRELSGPVKVRLYVSSGEAVPVQVRSFAKRVEDVLGEFRSASGGKLTIERYQPEPDSEAEDAAQLDGVVPQQLPTGESFYLGIAVSRLDRKQTIPAVVPHRERLLEYDLARAIARAGAGERPKIGLMSSLPILGSPFDPLTRRPAEPWVLASELRREFDVRKVEMSAASIDKDLDVLLLVHPRDIAPKTEYALDQFVLRGGKLVVFVDPFAFFDQQPGIPGMPPMGTSSSLPALFKAWGVTLQDGKVISDAVYGSGEGPRYTPTVLTLNRRALERGDVVTGQIESILYPFGGVFELKPAEGLKAQVIMTSSPTSMLVGLADANRSGDAATRDFKPGDKAWPLGLRLTGTFRSAFPEGAPKDAKPDAKPGAAKDAKPAAAHLAAGAKENTVVIVGDADMLADGAAVDIQEVFGQRIVVPSNGNLAFAVSLVEQFAAGDALISLRTRSSAYKPLTVVRQLEANAQRQYFGKIRALEEEKAKTIERLGALQKAKAPEAKANVLLTPEQEAELKRFAQRKVEIDRELRDVRRNLRQDVEFLEFWTKVANIALMPLAVAFAGIVVALVRRRRAQRAIARAG